ncbi:hypothetical protein FFLO_03790 [Filobasidium floriforme]|uniref:uridine/cytidine kinase n=1 Tax=Filobasidium floriforme TaxID=5210 RepID=A0A8K0NQI8_9TREE|nr:hypothetical protein FFLO_03790 [Filobasidium floriforme]
MSHEVVRKDEVLLSSKGRPPWYSPTGKAVPSYVIGIAGGSASGKTHVATSILRQLNHIPTCLILSQDSFYNKLDAEKNAMAHRNELDFDAPEAIDMQLFAQCVRDLKEGKAVNCPVYSFDEHQRLEETKYLYGASVIIVEGILTLCSPELRDLYDLKIFVNADSDVMLSRRILRDTKERGRDVDGIIAQYLRFVKRSYDTFVLPSSKHADIIVPGQDNDTAKVLLAAHVQREIDARSLRFRSKLMEQNAPRSRQTTAQDMEVSEEQEPFFTLLKQTNQLQGIMTILRDASTPRSEFIFYVDRLSSLVVEEALGMLEYGSVKVTTPLGVSASGMTMLQKSVVGVCIQRSGGPFVKGLRRVIRDVRIGALLIQSDNSTGEPLLFHTSLPDCVKSDAAKDTVVFLMDAQISTGAAAIMAVRVLLDHGIQERHIVFLTYLVAPQGLAAVYKAFPAVRIVAAAKGYDTEEWTFSLPKHATGTSSPVEMEDERSPTDADTGGSHHLQEAFKRLQFNRRSSDTPQETKKKAWIVVPDCGAFGDRYLGA